MRRLRGAIGFALLTALGFARGSRRRRRPARIVAEKEPAPQAELVVALLLFAAAACAAMFVLAYALDWPHLTQYLGLSLGAALALLAAAAVVAGRYVLPSEEVEQDYPAGRLDEQEKLAQIVAETREGITRRCLLLGAAGAAGAALGAALIVPAASFGPLLDTESFYYSPWRRDRRLVDEHGVPYRAEEIEAESFYTAYPESADREEMAAPVVVVRVDASELDLPPGRETWAPRGIVAYSKVCTHAGCAVALYRKPRFPAAEPSPALVCPCHYSTFDPAKGAAVTFGPAGRPLPQLPLAIDSKGELRAAGNLSGPVGPAFWGVRTRRPSA